MGIKNFFRRRPETPVKGQAVPDPVRIDLGERQRQGENFIDYVGWDALTPAPPSWKIPDLSEQMLWISSTIARHAEAGSLDEGVPDFMDREIHHRMAEIADEIQEAHRSAIRVEQDLLRQATGVQTRLVGQIEPLRQDRSCAEQGYLDAYEQLTGQRPDWSVAPRTVEPVRIARMTKDRVRIQRRHEAAEDTLQPEGEGPSPLRRPADPETRPASTDHEADDDAA